MGQSVSAALQQERAVDDSVADTGTMQRECGPAASGANALVQTVPAPMHDASVSSKNAAPVTSMQQRFWAANESANHRQAFDMQSFEAAQVLTAMQRA